MRIKEREKREKKEDLMISALLELKKDAQKGNGAVTWADSDGYCHRTVWYRYRVMASRRRNTLAQYG